MKRDLKLRLIVFVALLIVDALCCGRAIAANVIIAANERASKYADAIAKSIPDSLVISPQEKSKINQASLIVTVGNEPFVSLVGTTDVPIIASFVSYNTYYGFSESTRANTRAIFIEPSPSQLAVQIQQTFGGKPKVGYIYDSNDHYYVQLSEQNEITLVGIPLAKSVLQTLNVFYSRKPIDGFYISENRDIYNNSNILLVLESVYRNRIPTITSNPSLEGRGSVLSLLVPYDELILRTIDVVARIQKGIDVNTDNFGTIDKNIDTKLAQKLNFSLSGVKQ